MARKPVTIHDIARKLNISASTVSRALNNHPRISVETIRKVKNAARKFNYQPNVLASSLRTGKGRSIGLIVPKINRFFFADTISGIESVITPAGFNLIICQSNEQYSREVENVKTLISSRVAGIIISISGETRDAGHLKMIIENDIPLVQFDRACEGIRSSKVLNTNEAGAFEATTHLIQRGYRKIACFAGSLVLNIYQERLEGYRKALKSAGMKFDDEMVIESDLTYQFGIEATRELMENKHPDAIFSSGDFAALGALSRLKKMKIRVPRDVGVVGFANELVTDYSDPPLTSVNQFGYMMGNQAARRLLDEMSQDRQTRSFKTIMVPTQLVVRKSSSRSPSRVRPAHTGVFL